jgi:hypothetical protein
MAAAHRDHARRLMDRNAGLAAFAVHLSRDQTRVVTVEVWREPTMTQQAANPAGTTSAAYLRAATSGLDPTPVTDQSAGVIVIDIFAVWRPLLRPISAFNIRNGRAFNAAPGCISTTVLRGIGKGTIATYARWRDITDFLTAFSNQTGRTVRSTDDINAAAARMSFGLVRTDYHAYNLFAAEETQS